MKDMCFRCNDTKCPEVTKCFDLNGDLNQNLLMVPGPFQKCTSTPYPPSGRCTMCSLDYYYTVCRNVSESIQPALEANSTAITNYEQANCPVIGIASTTVNGSDFTGAAAQYGHPGGELWWCLLLSVLVVVCIGIIAYRCIKKRKIENHVI
ncbi:uncharacterized protein ACWYII_028412 isoform 1-T4 [Salvelinus alpinus]